MSKLFILGSGFSKAVFPNEMPLMKEFASCIKPELNKFPDHSVYRKFGTDIEGLLTYLYQEIPWRQDYDSIHDESLLLKLLDRIGEYIAECEEKAFTKQPPTWVSKFVKYIHDKEITVATFNYDTILEKLSKDLIRNANVSRSIYRIPISPLSHRASTGVKLGDLQSLSPNTYRLLKLHGSINWYFARDENLSGSPVYCSYIDEDPNDLSFKINKMGLKPLIIPPIVEKAPFYGNHLVKILWTELKEAIDEADEIYCVGYSLPKSDYTTQIFFSTVINKEKRKVYIVNKKCGSDDLIKNYKEALPNCKLVTCCYVTDDEPVAKMVADLK